MPITVKCPSCGKALNAPDSAAGKKAKCPGCAQILTVPAAVQEADLFAALPAEPAYSGAASPASAAGADQPRQPCPECGEMIVVGAAKCRFCNAIFDPNLKQMSGAGSSQLKQIAQEQRSLLLCILFYLIAAVGAGVANASAGPQGASPLAGIAGIVGLIASIAAMVFVFRLATKLYSKGAAIAYCVLTLIPCIGLIILLMINGAATKKLKEQGIKVGFLGADMSQF